MRVFVLTLGTRGDLELFLALGCALRDRGHRVVVGTSPFHAGRVSQLGLKGVAVGDAERSTLVSVLRSLAAVSDRVQRTRLYHDRWLGPQLRAFRDAASSFVADADYFISNVKLVLQRGRRVLPGAAITYDLPSSLEDLRRYPSCRAGDAILDLVALSRPLVDPNQVWPTDHRFTGFWNAAGSPPSLGDGLREFLDAEPAPVVATLGSMVTFDAARFARSLAEALRACGRRGVIVGGWSELSRVVDCDDLHIVQQAPYDQLFPRAACVLHHGGTGTVSAVLRAGRPSVVLPQMLCQERFAEVLVGHGIATGVFDVDIIDPSRLANAIERAATDAQVLRRARDWQRQVRKEAGLEAAVDAIEAHARSHGGGSG